MSPDIWADCHPPQFAIGTFLVYIIITMIILRCTRDDE